MFDKNDIQIAFKTAIIKGVTKPETIDIFNIPIGHIYDILVDNMENEEYRYHYKGDDVHIMVTDDPDGIAIHLENYFFLLDDSLEIPLWKSRYLADRNLSDIPFCQAWVCVMETLQALLDENDIKPQELCKEWNG